MYTLECIEDRMEIQHCQNVLVERLTEALPSEETLKLGHQGDYIENRVHFRERDGLWFSWKSLEEVGVPRYWNGFGISLKSGSADIVVEINPPLEGVTGQVAGLFAKDPQGRRYLIHRGRLGGGRRGVGLNAFWEWYRGASVNILTKSNNSFEALYVCCVDSRDAVENVYRFVREVKQFKDEVREGSHSRVPGQGLPQTLLYNPEFFGRKRGGLRKISDHFSWHGRVVDALYKSLAEVNGDDQIFNTREIDIGVHGFKEPKTIYEIKTNCSSQSIYTGIGQLFFHTSGLEAPKKVLVLPRSELGDEIRNIIESMGIEVLSYRFARNSVQFEG